MTQRLSFHRAGTLARSVGGAALLCAVSVVSARAQASLSTQGFGYPTGQLSARAYGAGGAVAENDPLSPVNPASMALIRTRMLSFQIEPEFRSVKTAAGSEQTTTARYPNVFGAMPFAANWVVSVGSSTLLDRTSTTSFKTTQFLTASDSVPMTTTYRVDGAMNDVRLAAGWSPKTWLRLGVGAHAITGHNLVSITQAFADSVQFASFTQQRVLGFSGIAGSAGVHLVAKAATLALSARHGGTLELTSNDTVLTSGTVPDRYGASLIYTGIPNSMIAVRTSRDKWSTVGSLGATGLEAVDAWDSSIGADVAGPKISERIVFIRGGFRTRTLPFAAAGAKVTEKSVTAGAGTAFAGNRVLADLAVIRASRSAALSASENAWTISIGISIRP